MIAYVNVPYTCYTRIMCISPSLRIDCTRKTKKTLLPTEPDISLNEVVFAAIVFQSNYDWFNCMYILCMY